MMWTQSRCAPALALLIALSAGSIPVEAAAPKAEAVGYATGISVEQTADARLTEVKVELTKPGTFSSRVERDGTRLIVDIPRSELKGTPPALTEAVGLVAGVMAQSFDTPSGKVTRVIVTLARKAEHSVAVDGSTLRIRLAATRADLLPAVGAAATPPAAVAASGERTVPGTARIADVGYQRVQGQDRVEIQISEGARIREVQGVRGTLELVIENATLPEPLSRTLDVSAYNGSVRSVSSYQKLGSASTVIIEVERKEGCTSRIQRRGDRVIWSFSEPGRPAAVPGVAADGGIARRPRTVSVEDALDDLPEIRGGYAPFAHTAGELTREPDQAGAFGPTVLAQQRAYSGRRIDLDLKDADIHNVLRLLADVGAVNIVTSDEVKGAVTIRMRNVPWDQALDVVLQAKGLGMVQQANMIRVAPLAQLEKEREMEVARRRQEVKLAPVETRLIPVSYAQAADIQARAQPLLSERGSIAVDERTNVLIVRDIAGNLNQIEELTRALDTQTPQVLVEARIVEATSRYLRDVGIQWGGDASMSAATGNPTGLVFPNSVGMVGGASDADTPTAGLSPFANTISNPNFAVNLPATVGTGTGGAIGLTFGSVDNTINLAVRLSAAESSGMLRILSSPRVLTLDNREARIAQGTLIPFSQISAQGVQTTFQEAKLQLLVRPHVTADGSVSMHVKINRDEPDFNQTSPRGDPTILKREAETDLLVMDGHTAVIGGIFTRNTGRNLDQVPFFGDIPLLGLLFQRRRSSDTRSELVIFLTPRIVNRAEALGR
jgi:type IV pilus assembly protein PilQ